MLYLISYKIHLQSAFGSSFPSISQFMRPVVLQALGRSSFQQVGFTSTHPQLLHLREGHPPRSAPSMEGVLATVATSSRLSGKSEKAACPDHTAHLGPAVRQLLNAGLQSRSARRRAKCLVLHFCNFAPAYHFPNSPGQRHSFSLFLQLVKDHW